MLTLLNLALVRLRERCSASLDMAVKCPGGRSGKVYMANPWKDSWFREVMNFIHKICKSLYFWLSNLGRMFQSGVGNASEDLDEPL